MIVGTVVGVAQTNVKRMLAYSSIAHAGYLMLGIVAANETGKARDALLPAGLRGDQPRARSASLRCSARRDRPHDQLRDFAGLWHAAARPGRR